MSGFNNKNWKWNCWLPENQPKVEQTVNIWLQPLKIELSLNKLLYTNGINDLILLIDKLTTI